VGRTVLVVALALAPQPLAPQLLAPQLLAPAYAAPSVAAPLQDDALAPDGRRGFGSRTRVSDVYSVLRSAKDPDRRFLADLANLASEVQVLAASSLEAYRANGYLDLLDPLEIPSLPLLIERYRELADEPFEALARGDAKALALAKAIHDTRFRARTAALAGFDFEVRELSSGLAVFRAATDGYVELDQDQASNVAARVDLAASLLRAMRSDLQTLRQSFGEVETDPTRAAELVRLASESEGENVRRASVERICAEARRLEERMSGALFTTRLRSEVAELLDWRARLFEESAKLRADALAWLPDTDEGRAAPDAVQKLPRHERTRRAFQRGLEGLAFDPLDAELAWACGHAVDFVEGARLARPFFDRFLALRGIRAHDHRTYAKRDLDAREQEALDAVQRSLLPQPGRPKGG
jgi:hypothetical protein